MNPQTPDANSTAPIVSEFSDDADMLELVEMFVDELPDRASAIQDAATAEDNDAISHLAHQLKGSGGGYGFPILTDVAAKVEKLARSGDDLAQLNVAINELCDICRRATAQ